MSLTNEDKSGRLFKALMGVSETRLGRDFFEEPVRTAASVLPKQIWKYGDVIPTASPQEPLSAIGSVRALEDGEEWSYQFDESTTRPIVRRWKSLKLSKIDGGTNNAFQALDGSGNPIRNIIPFNYGDGVTYNYKLEKNDNTPIAFGVGDWVLDNASGVLTFYGDVPSGVSAANPPRLSFFQYIGGLGVPESVTGFEGVIVPVTNVSGPANVSAWTSAQPSSDLSTRVTEALSQVWDTPPGYTPTFDWDGADDNEGVAVSFEKMIPLRYSHSRNPVKSGVGTSEDSEVVTLMTRRLITGNVPEPGRGYTVDFASQQTPLTAGQVQLRFSTPGSFELSIDGGATWGPQTSGFNSLIKNRRVKVSNGDVFVVVRRIAGNLPTATTTDTLTLSDNGTTVGFFYWDTEAKAYLPWLMTDASYNYDFGVPIVNKLGKIPASVKIDQMGTGGFGDSITPEYYGVRAETVVIAVKSDNSANDTLLPEGVDYLVRNRANEWLEDILARIEADRPGFGGKILLRAGRYQVNRDFSLTNRTAGWKLEGESRSGTIIESSTTDARTITIHGDGDDSSVFFESLQFVGSFEIEATKATTGVGYVSLRNVLGPDTDVIINDDCDLTILDCPSLRNLEIQGTTASLGDRLVVSSVFAYISHNGSNTIYRDIKVNTFWGYSGGVQSWIDSSYINTLGALNTQNQYSNNTVLAYGAVPERFKMDTGKIEVIDETDSLGAGTRRWTSFADPIIYDSTLKKFTLEIDDRTLYIDSNDGKLYVRGDAETILFDAAPAGRPYDNYEAGSQGPDVVAANVQEALEDIYATKADLINGVLPLQQLPDAIAHAGLKFKGMWSFEASNGEYPTWADVRDYDVDEVDEWPEPQELQPGWFVVVKNSTVEANNPAREQIADPQPGETSGIVFTAGDWAIWNGTKWEKVDNSVANAVYSILPDNPPSRGGAPWDEFSGGPGLLDFDDTTIVDGMDLINEILRKLAPPKPVKLEDLTLISRTPGSYSAIDAYTHIPRTSVYDATDDSGDYSVIYGTPGDMNANSGDINDLFFDADAGTLTAFIDGVAEGSTVLTPANDSGDSAVGIYNALVVTADADPWDGVSGKENFWRGLRAHIDPNVDATSLQLGKHTYKLTHSRTGSTPEVTFYVDNPAPIGDMQIVSASFDSSNESAILSNVRHVSGAPSVRSSEAFKITQFDANDVVGRFYNQAPVRVECNVSGVADMRLTPASTPATPPDGDYGPAQFSPVNITMPATAYQENIEFTLTPINSREEDGVNVETISTGFRIDTISEDVPNALGGATATRVYSGDGTSWFPSLGNGALDCGGPYDSNQSLVTSDYMGELQRIGINGGRYRWPSGDYTAMNGPDYTSAAGETIGGDEWRWVTFKLDNALSVNSAFTLTLTDPNGMNANNNQITADMYIFVRVGQGSNSTGWLDANQPFSGVGSPTNNGHFAMVSGDSTANVKRVTFGSIVRSGDLYVRIGVKRFSNIWFSGISVTDLT